MSDLLSRFREAGRNGLGWHQAVDALDASLRDETDPEAYDAASHAYDAGQRDRARAAVARSIMARNAPAGDAEEMVELREFYDIDRVDTAMLADAGLTKWNAHALIERAAEAAPVEPEEIVEIVGEFCPLPSNALRLAEIAFREFQSIPRQRMDPLPVDPQASELRQIMASMVGAAECLEDLPKIERAAVAEKARRDAALASGPTKVEHRLTAADARAECEAAIERSRAAVGFPPLPRLRWVDYSQGATYSPPSWLVKNVLPGRGLGLIYGESSAGKTFLAVHASLCIAWGLPFFGRRAKPGGVLYIAAEGGSGVLPRFDAAEHALEGAIAAAHLTGSRDPAMSRAPIRIVTEAPNLSRDGDPAPLIRTIREAVADFERLGFRLAMVIVDTWHAALGGGDENSAADAGHALKPLKDAIEEMNLFALIVHHPGKDVERGARGSGSLPAAVDTSIELRVPGCVGPIAKPADMMRCATVVKQRDGAVGETLHYRLPIVTIGVDEDGEPWTTCTVQPCDAPKHDDDGLRKTDRQFIETVKAAITREGVSGRVEIKKVRGAFYNSRSDDKPDTRRRAWNRALNDAVKAGRVEIDDHDEFVWVPAEPAGERDTGTGL